MTTALRIRTPVVAGAFAALAATAVVTAPAAPASGAAPADVAGSAARTPNPAFLLERGRFTTFDAPGATTGTTAFGINDRGQIVGKYNDGTSSSGPGAREHGFVRHPDGRFTTIDLPGVRSTSPLGINDRGQIVGVYSLTTGRVGDDPNRRAFLLERGRVTWLDAPGARYTQAYGVNDRGQVVGEFQDAAGYHGFRWEKGRFTTIDAPGEGLATSTVGIDDGGRIVGITVDLSEPTRIRGFLLDRHGFTAVVAPGRAATAPLGINDRGRIVGTLSDADLSSGDGFLLTGLPRGRPRFTTFDVPGAASTVALGVNDRGQIVGSYAPGAG